MLTADVRDSADPAIGRIITWQAELVLVDLPTLEAAERAIEDNILVAILSNTKQKESNNNSNKRHGKLEKQKQRRDSG